MSDINELEATPDVSTSAVAEDRRRPGRIEDVHAGLIPILRGTEPTIEFEPEDIDQTAALRGLVAGVVFSAPIWVAIAYFGSWLMSR